MGFIAENDVILSSIERQLEAMDSNMVQVKYNSRAKSYNFTPSASMNSAQLQPWVEVQLEDGHLLRTKLLVSNNQFLALASDNSNNNNNNNTFVERHSAVASEALAEQVS